MKAAIAALLLLSSPAAAQCLTPDTIGTMPSSGVVCLSPGTYGVLSLTGASNLRITAPQGGVLFEASHGISRSNTKPYGIVNVLNSTQVELDDITIVNDYAYVPGTTDSYSEVSNGLYANNVTELVLSHVTIRTHGKQGLYLYQSSVVAVSSTIQAGYMEIVGYSSSLRGSDLTLVQNYVPSIPLLETDRHSAIWLEGTSDFEMANTTITMNTGAGVVVSNEPVGYSQECGANPDPSACLLGFNHLVLFGTTTLSPVTPQAAWSQAHPSHTGLLLELRGHYPALPDYWPNPVNPIGPATPPNLIRMY